MTIYERLNSDTAAFVLVLLWFASMLFSEHHILIELFFYIGIIGLAIGLLQALSEVLEDYYCEKRSKRAFDKWYSEITSRSKD